MRILGIDPGYGRMGYGCLEITGSQILVLDVGCFETHKDEDHGDRLVKIAARVRDLVSRHKPDVVGIEKLFFSKNVRTAMKVSEARGVILATLMEAHARLVECSPQEVKIAVTGYGNAEKQQVQFMVKCILGLKEVPKPDDAADALAIAIAASRLYNAR